MPSSCLEEDSATKMIVWMVVSIELRAVAPIRIQKEHRRALLDLEGISLLQVGGRPVLVVPRTSLAGALRSLATSIAGRLALLACRWDKLPDSDKELIPDPIRVHMESLVNRVAWCIARCHDSDRVHGNKPWLRRCPDRSEEKSYVETYSELSTEAKRRKEHVRNIEEAMGREPGAVTRYQASALCPVCSLLGSQAMQGRIKLMDIILDEYILEIVGRNSIDPSTRSIWRGHVFYETVAVAQKPAELMLTAYRLVPGSPEALLLGLLLRHIMYNGIRLGGTKTVGRGLLLAPSNAYLRVRITFRGDARSLLSGEEPLELGEMRRKSPEELLDLLAGQ